MKKTKKSQTKLFVTVFAVLAVLVVMQNLLHKNIISLPVPNNAGCSLLESIDNHLVAIFQDGQVAVWDWGTMPPQQQSDFKLASDRAILLDVEHLAGINKEGDKLLTVNNLPTGSRKKEFSVGWTDQDVWLRISPDKKTTALIRRNPQDSKGNTLYEFLTVDINKELTSQSATISIAELAEEFEDFAVGNDGILYAVGSEDDLGRIAAVGLRKGSIVWDMSFENTKEFCSVMVSPDSEIFYAGNRNGILYKMNGSTGDIIKKIQLLEKGETRPITNDYSVLNLAFSPDGQYYVATINPKAYILEGDTDEIIHIVNPADKLVSKIAFSPDNRFIATSDIRAGYPIKIWALPQEK